MALAPRACRAVISPASPVTRNETSGLVMDGEVIFMRPLYIPLAILHTK